MTDREKIVIRATLLALDENIRNTDYMNERINSFIESIDVYDEAYALDKELLHALSVIDRELDLEVWNRKITEETKNDATGA